jgi:hypothetical protein
VCRRTGHTMVGVRLLPLPQHLIHLSSQFAAPKPNLPILGSYQFLKNARNIAAPQSARKLLEVIDETAELLLKCRSGIDAIAVVYGTLARCAG